MKANKRNTSSAPSYTLIELEHNQTPIFKTTPECRIPSKTDYTKTNNIEAMVPKVIVLTLLCAFHIVIGQELKNHRVADKNGIYHIFWEANTQDITFEVQVATKGYVGFGFSPNGGMPGADVVIGWVLPNGTTIFHDRHALGFYEPLIDTQQNYELIKGYENETHTVLRFKRKLNTCDKENDTIITDDTMKLIFSWHPDDPKDITGLPYHGPDHRGIKDTLLLSSQPPPLPITDDITIWEVTMPNVTVPPQITTYWCHVVKLPDFEEEKDYIGFQINITPGNEKLIHHFVLYECLGNETRLEELMAIKGGYECIVEGTLAPPAECQPPIVIWVAGSEGQVLPEGVGVAVGKKIKRTFFQTQIHYNNMEKKSGIIDNTSLQLYLTNKKQPIQAAFLQLYANIDYSFIIPPNQPEFSISAFCPPACTQKAFPKEGITVFAAGLHAHLKGKRMSLRHYRGNQELKPIVEENNYNFNYQALRQLREPVQVLPGDILLTSCTYTTLDTNTTMAGGYGSEAEMCASYMSYYPAMPLSLCIGGPHYDGIFDYFGVEKLGEDKIHIESPASLQNKSMFTYLHEYDWSTVDGAKLQRMRDMQYYDVKSIYCQNIPSATDQDMSVEFPYPNLTMYEPAEDTCQLKTATKINPIKNDYEKKTTPKKQYY